MSYFNYITWKKKSQREFLVSYKIDFREVFRTILYMQVIFANEGLEKMVDLYHLRSIAYSTAL